MEYSNNTAHHYIDQFILAATLPSFVTNSMRFHPLDKGEYLCHRGDLINGLFFLVKGKLRVESIQENGKLAVLSFETPLSIIGDLELIEEKTILADVTTIEQSAVLSITKEVLERSMQDVAFLRFVCRYLSQKLFFTSSLLMHSTSSLQRRLINYILLRSQSDGVTFDLENRESVAALLGVSVRHLNRTFHELVESDALSLQGKSLRVRNVEILRGMLDLGT